MRPRPRLALVVALLLPLAAVAEPPDPNPATNVCRDLGEPDPVDACRAEGVSLYQADYVPAFRDRVCITAKQTAETTDISVRWPSKSQRRESVSIRVPRANVATFLTAIAETQPQALKNRPNEAGCDGMWMTGLSCDSKQPAHAFSVWSPESGTAHQKYFLSLARLALEVMSEQAAIEHLEDVIAYLTDELTVRDLGGSPRAIRLYGSLTSDESPKLKAYLEDHAAGEPLVIDASNFHGTGTLAYPTFVAIDRRPAGTMWVATGAIARYLVEIGIRKQHIVVTIEEARRRLASH